LAALIECRLISKKNEPQYLSSYIAMPYRVQAGTLTLQANFANVEGRNGHFFASSRLTAMRLPFMRVCLVALEEPDHMQLAKTLSGPMACRSSTTTESTDVKSADT
jgi:hypothetical protein